MNYNDLELEVLIHRYIYYVLDDNIISDYAYDRLERKARDLLPPTSPVQGIGSSLASSYTEDIKQEAQKRVLERDKNAN